MATDNGAVHVPRSLREAGSLFTAIFSAVAVAVLVAIYNDVRELTRATPILMEKTANIERIISDHENRLREMERGQ